MNSQDRIVLDAADGGGKRKESSSERITRTDSSLPPLAPLDGPEPKPWQK